MGVGVSMPCEGQKHGEEWCQDRWALGVLGWTGKMAAWVRRFLWRLREWLMSAARGPTSLPQWLLESPSTGREWHTHFPMHASSNYWKFTPVYTDISGSATASPMPLQDKLLLPCINELILLRELPTSDTSAWSWVQSQVVVHLLCIQVQENISRTLSQVC